MIGSAAPKHRRINNEADLRPGHSAIALVEISLILHCAMRGGAAERVRAVVRKIIHEIQNSVTLCEQLYFRRLSLAAVRVMEFAAPCAFAMRMCRRHHRRHF